MLERISGKYGSTEPIFGATIQIISDCTAGYRVSCVQVEIPLFGVKIFERKVACKREIDLLNDDTFVYRSGIVVLGENGGACQQQQAPQNKSFHTEVYY